MACISISAKAAAEGEEPCTNVTEANRPGGFAAVANSGLALTEAMRSLAGVQRDAVAARTC